MSQEYNNSTAGAAGCTYSRLANIYSGQNLNKIVNQGTYIVPKLCPNGPIGSSYPPKYDTLSHGQKYLCGGHFDVKGAYPMADCASCNVDYVQRPCTGNIAGQCNSASVEGYRRKRNGFKLW